MGDNLRVSVIVSTYTTERKNDVLRSITSLKKQSYEPYEVLLVLDPVDELVDFYTELLRDMETVKIVKSSGFGLSNARNSGINHANGDIVAFIDDDAWADERWLENMVKNYEDKDVWGVGGKIVPVFDTRRPRWLPEELDWIVGCTYKGMPETKTEVRNPIGANMSFRKEAFEVAGLFSSEIGRYGRKLVGSEEAEFSMRLKMIKPEIRIVYEPQAIVYHRVPENRTEFRYALRRAYYEGISKAILGKKYPLNTEYKYLSNLLKTVIYKIIEVKFYEVVGIVAIIALVGIGNFIGKMGVRKGV